MKNLILLTGVLLLLPEMVFNTIQVISFFGFKLHFEVVFYITITITIIQSLLGVLYLFAFVHVWIEEDKKFESDSNVTHKKE